MSFWNLSGGESALEGRTGEFDAGGGSFALIPDGTTVLALVNDAKWASNFDKTAEYVNVQWEINAPEEYANRRVFQKIWVGDLDPSIKDKEKQTAKRDKAIKMLAAIDSNAGGKLGKMAGRPDDDDLALALVGKMMTIRLGVWEMDTADGLKSGNWVQYVNAKAAYKEASGGAVKKPAAQKQAAPQDLDDDIPF